MNSNRPRFKSLDIESGKITSSSLIEAFLGESEHSWLLDCELESAEIKIEDGIVQWLDGILYWGHWKWGVWNGGEFRSGTWNGGIFFSGLFGATWNRGVWKGGSFSGKDLTGKLQTLKEIERV